MKIAPALSTKFFLLGGMCLILSSACLVGWDGPYHSQKYRCQVEEDCLKEEGYHCVRLRSNDTDRYCVQACQEDNDCDAKDAHCMNYQSADPAAPTDFGSKFCSLTPGDGNDSPCAKANNGDPGTCNVGNGEYCLFDECYQLNIPCNPDNDQCATMLSAVFECVSYSDGSFCALQPRQCADANECHATFSNSNLVCVPSFWPTIEGNVCAAPNCESVDPDSDPNEFQWEPSTNCGGRCGPCPLGHRCLNNKDCQSGNCAPDAHGGWEKNCQP